MTDHKKDFEQIIREELLSEAEMIQEEVRASGLEEISAEKKDRMWEKIQEQIKMHEEEVRINSSEETSEEFKTEFSEELSVDDIYEKLSAEDKEALRLGRKITHVKKKSRKMYLILAAAIVLVLAFGMTTMGGAERISQVMKDTFGEREVTKVNSDEEAKVVERDEDKAYQEIEDIFGVSAVRMLYKPDRMDFAQMDIDDIFQTAEILYKYNDKNFIFIISAGYMQSSFGIDAEDVLVESETIEVEDNKIELNIYELSPSGDTRCSAKFKYKGLEYFLMGTMEKEEFMKIVENLYFS